MTLAAVAAGGAMAACAAGFLALQPGWLGARLGAGPEDCAVILSLTADGPLQRGGARPGDCLLSVGGVTGIGADDLTEDPDQFASRVAQSAYHQRQSALARALAGESVRVELRSPGEAAREATIAPGVRPIVTFPPTFWAMIAAGFVGLIVGAWVWMLRPGDPAARWFGLSGVGLFVAAAPPAVYSTRELAIDGALQWWLSLVNHLGGIALGLGLAFFFLRFPNPIGARWLSAALFAGVSAWFAADLAQLTPPVWFYFLDLAQMASILLAWGAQTLLTSRDCDKRVALLWLGVAAVFGIAAAGLGMIGPVAFGAEPLMSQGYLFAFFGAFYGTVAVGVGRHHMFDLGRWSYRILFYAVGATVMMAIDAALVYGMKFERNFALMGSILIVGLTYLPARDILWRRYAAPRRPPTHEVFGAAMDVAFGVSESEQDRRWRDVLDALFDPLEMEGAAPETATPTLADGRVELLIPAVAGSPALRLRHPYGGKALFTSDDVKMAARMVELVRRAERARDDYARGVIEERARIARDLHDDLGARLLAGAVGADADARALSQAALKDLRSILADLSTGARDLDEGLANLRQETAERVAEAGLTLDWPPIDEALSRHKIDPRQMKALASSVREAVSNAIRHSGGTRVAVRLEARDGRLRMDVRDDGNGLSDATPSGTTAGYGHGLANIRERMRAAEGDVNVNFRPDGVEVTFDVPLTRTGMRGDRADGASTQATL